MKRPFKPTVQYHASIGIVSLDFTEAQLTAIGRITMNYNEVEGSLFLLFRIATELPVRMAVEIFTRLGGIDGVTAIIKRGAKDAGLSDVEQRALEEALGENGFGKYKKCRDAVIHARAYNAPAGIGYLLERRAKQQEVLLTVSALETLASHIANLRDEIEHFADIIVDRRQGRDIDPDNPEEARDEEAFQAWLPRYQECRNRRLALPPLPEFPAESELLSARHGWIDSLPLSKRQSDEE